MIRGSLKTAGHWALASVVLFFASILASAQHQLTFRPYHSSGIYELGEIAGWNVRSVPNATILHYWYTVKKNNKDVVKIGQLDLSSGAASIEVQLNEPAMILVEVFPDQNPASPLKNETTHGNDSPRTESDPHANQQPAPETVLGAAIAPALLGPSVDRPSDFDEFWREKLKLLARIQIDPELIPVPNVDPAVDLYTVKLDSVDSHVQGYLAKPRRAGKYPALIQYQYAGVYKLGPDGSIKYAHDGWLTFDVDSHDIAPTVGTGVPTDYYKIGNRDRERCYFLDMYLRDTRAIDYIMSRPDWDGKTIVLVGTSMGGQQSLVTAALNPGRVTAVIVNEPAGADTNGDLHGRKAGYPYWDSSDPEVMKTSLYFDPVNFAPLIKAPTIIGVGFIDTTAPPAGLWTIFNQLTAPKEIVPMVESAHNNRTPDKQGNFTNRSEAALDTILHGRHLELVNGPLEPGTN